ncbi:MAG: gfo/Idh/MocA family oxidoreductase, partial [Arenibacter sp.]|nr:gfo/Idh/MocA family oxidoreductase [Arenibacter sp.]
MKFTRRDALKGLGGIPLMGAVWWAGAANTVAKKEERTAILEHLNIQPSLPTAVPGIGGEPVRIGIIGFGIRGEQLCRALGFATKEWREEMRLVAEENPKHSALSDFDAQDKLNIKLTGICDV